MAVTEKNITSTGATSYTFEFEYLKTADVKVSVNGTATTEFIVPNGAPTTVQFNSGHVPASGAAIRIYRDTDVDTLSATFYAGSAIKSQDLNDNFNQNLFVTQEAKRDVAASWTTGDETIISTETWVSNNNRVSTTAAQDARIDAKIDTALTTDVAAGNKITVTDNSPGSGQITIAVTSGSLVDSDINASAGIVGSKLANDSVTLDKLGSGALPTDITVASANIVNGTIVDADIATGTLDNRYYTKTDLNAGQLNNLYYTESELDAGQLDNRYYTETELLTNGVLDGRYFTQTEADQRYYNLDSVEEIQSGETWVAADNKVATTAAIDASIVDLVDDVGGFVPIANETSFPNANPDVDNGTGTLVSVPLANNLTSNGSGVISISNGTVGNSTVTITGAANSTTYAAGFGLIVETTSTLNTYTLHRHVPKATEVTTVAGNISNITTVGGISANVTTVAGVASNVTTVAGIAANVTAVAGDATDIGTVAGAITNVNNVGGSIANVNTTAGSIANVNTTAAAIANVNTVAGISSNVTTVAGISSNVTAVAGDATDIGTVAGAIANVNTVAGIASNVTTVAGDTTAINNITTNLSAVQNAATNATNAASSATSAATSATTATTQASTATTQATNAATSATNAATSATSSASSATTATTQASTATTQASNASTSAANALAYKNLALQYRDTTSGILTQSNSIAYNLSDSASSHTSWGDITDGGIADFSNEVGNTALTMAEGSATYNYGSIT